jgi:serine/threonine-protein kinase
MLYELLTSRLPFDAESYAALIVKVRTEEPPPISQVAPGVPSGLAQAVMVGLAKGPMKRWQTARDFASALREALALPPAPRPLATGGPLRLEPARVTDLPARVKAPALSQYTSPDGLRQTERPAASRVAAPPSAVVTRPPAPVAVVNRPAAPVVSAPTLAGPEVPALAAPALSGPAPGAPVAPRKMNRALKWTIIVLAVIGACFACCVGSALLEGYNAEAKHEALRKANEP